MATTYTNDKAASTYPARAGIDLTAAWSSQTLSAALVVNDKFEMVRVPSGATILEIVFSTTDMDQSTGLVYDVGDGGDTDRFIDSAGVGQAAGVARLNAPGGFQYQYTSEDTVDVLVETAPTTSETSGTIKLGVIYSMNN